MNGSPESVGIMDSSCDSAVFYFYLNVRSWHRADRQSSLDTISLRAAARGSRTRRPCLKRWRWSGIKIITELKTRHVIDLLTGIGKKVYLK